MEARAFKPFFVIIGLLLATSLTLAMTVNTAMTNESGIHLDLPDIVGDWEGSEILYCQKPDCQQYFTKDELNGSEKCLSCSSPLASMTLIERELLPADTKIVKKVYRQPNRPPLFVTIVMSGVERSSIHRPERCLVGQGSEIVDQKNVAVPLEGRKDDLQVRVLDMIRRVRHPSGEHVAYGRYYAYWFVGKDRETPSHYSRLFWMAADRVFKNKAHRWSYISISGNRDMETDEYLDEVRDFAGKMYPHIITEPSLKPSA